MYEIYVRNTPLLITDATGSGLAYSRDDLLIDVSPQLVMQEIIDYMEQAPPHRRVVLRAASAREGFAFLKTQLTVVTSAGGAVWSPQGNLLMIYRNGRWDLPKGKVEAGERIEQTAIREVEEECGLRRVSVVSRLIPTYHTYRHQGKSFLKETYWLEMRAREQSSLRPQLEEGITFVDWVRPVDLAGCLSKTYPNILRLLRQSYPQWLHHHTSVLGK
jgi:8-oxo-dGTP pyrophosphatase MutT (NUDIX family)